MIPKLLFLDVDGVLNCKTTRERYGNMLGIELNKVQLVKEIVFQTGALIVLSSGWRLYKPDANRVSELIKLHSMTPNLKGLTDRGCEIEAWLSENEPVDRYAILDDSSDFHKDQPLFRTNWEVGLTPEIATQIIEYLNKGGNDAERDSEGEADTTDDASSS